MPTLISKAFNYLLSSARGGGRGSLSNYVINAPHEWGQPRPGIADVQGQITPERMREIAMKVGTVAACMNATLDYAAGVKINLRNIDPAKKADKLQVQYIKKFMRKPNRVDTWRRFRWKIERDMWTMGWAAVEIERDAAGNLANLNVLDAARLYVDYDEHGNILGYDMRDARGMPIHGPDGTHAWNPDEVIYFSKDPISSSRYPTSRLQQLFSLAVLEDLMIYFISGKFTESNVPFGVYDLGEISEDELKSAIDLWNEQATSNHRVLLTGSKNGGKWNVFGYHLKDLEAVALLAEIRGKIMSIVGVTMNELGESQDINKSNGYNLSFTFKKRAIEPLLDEEIDTLSQGLLWNTLHFDELEFYYEEIDSRDMLLQAQINEILFKIGAITVNDMLNGMGKPSVPGGDDHLIGTGSAYIPVDMVRAFAQAQLAALLMIDQAGADGAGGGAVSPPLIRSMQPPMKFVTPDGQGSSTPKIRLPQPENQQKPRGPVQIARNQGLRKEEMHGS